MATPKKRTGKASQNSRRANWKGSIPATTTCPNCKSVIPTHTVCPECGYYKNGFASIKKQQENTAVEPVKETKKAKAKKEVAEEETKAEETSQETVEEPKKTRKPRAKKAKTEEDTQEAQA
ncbi:MAG: 50S ribosomal protein L32 [Candidatus Gastranaerophilales bacterium]|nr:50S ribosomal protein L32 [Candidatus Gastranaerophilales bacterium]